MMDLSIVWNSYLTIFGNVTILGSALMILMLIIMTRMGANIDAMIIVLIPAVCMMCYGATVILPVSVGYIASFVIGVIIAIAIVKLIGY